MGDQYGLAVGDQRHRAVVNGIWEVGKGFQLSGLYFFGSGERLATSYGGDLRNMGAGSTGRLRPDGTIVPRNNFVGNSLNRVDLRLQQRVRVGGVTLESMLELFNAFNYANYGGFTTAESNASYGAPTSNPNVAYQPRMMQLGFRVTF
jgi:hypothetical protein